MYNLSDYGSMIADSVRMDPYAYALKAAISPDSVVLDIGTGSGIHALLAAKFGARRVYAVESNEAIRLARELAEANGFAKGIEFIQGDSTEVTLPEQADVIVSDLRGVLPPFGLHIKSIVDARQRHLAPGGTLIPQRDTLWVALVEARGVYDDLIEPWNQPYGLAMETAKEIVLNSWSDDQAESFGPGNLLTEAQIWAVMDYATIDDPHVGCSNMVQNATRDGTAHGLNLWFDTELADGIGFSNGPQSKKVATVYGRAFFPLLEPVSISKGDRISLSIHADFLDSEYVWRWQTNICDADDPAIIKADFSQSTDFERKMIDEHVAEHFSNTRPTLGQEGEMALFGLRKMDGVATLEEIAMHVQEAFPARFLARQDAILYVYDLSQQYRHSQYAP
jgi:protein arginine N-methyltransferase 1